MKFPGAASTCSEKPSKG